MARREAVETEPGLGRPSGMTLNEVIVSSASAALALQRDDGSMPPGHNGPYHDPETPVRNTGHWLITFAKAHETSGDHRFSEAARRAAEYLYGQNARPENATFSHRTNPAKDRCNGLIGQAWTIEALAIGARALGMPELAALGEQVFVLHPFDEREGLWSRVDTDGAVLGFDVTFNHQLWFAAAGSLLPGSDGAVAEQVRRFLGALPENMSLYPKGLIRHRIAKGHIGRSRPGPKQAVKSLLRGMAARKVEENARYHKAIGYHAFNLYAFALLNQALPDHPFWESDSIRSALRYVESDEFLHGLDDNEYGYPYNPPGFEIAFAHHVFAGHYGRDTTAEMAEWVSRQLGRCYDFNANQMRLGTEDANTHAARIYEATRLPDIPIRVSVGAPVE